MSKPAKKGLPLYEKANRYAARAWVPDNPTRLKINSLMYYAYLAGYKRARKEFKAT